MKELSKLTATFYNNNNYNNNNKQFVEPYGDCGDRGTESFMYRCA